MLPFARPPYASPFDAASASAIGAPGLLREGRVARIVVVDDSRTQATMLSRLLRAQSYEVHVAHDGSEGLETAVKVRPDLIISDIVMPLLDGYTMCESIKRDPHLNTTPVMLLTMLSDPSDILLGLQAGADYYLTKPCDDSYLLATVAAVLAQPHQVEDVRSEPLDVAVGDRYYKVAAGRRQMLNLLLSTYGNAVEQNRVLLRTQHELQTLNAQLVAQRRQIEAQQRELEEANGRWRILATRDGLTGLHNRRAFGDRLDEEFARATRHGAPLSLVLLDVDKFKQYNDTFGHPAGDEVLRQVARAMQSQARRGDFPARYGGEEFAVLLPQTDGESALVVAERLRLAVASMPWDKRPVTASFGIATLEGSLPMEPAALLAGADTALYASKAKGRNCVTHARELNALPTATQPSPNAPHNHGDSLTAAPSPGLGSLVTSQSLASASASRHNASTGP